MTTRSIALSDELIRRALRPASDVDAPPDLLDAILADVAVTRPRRRIIAWPWTPEAPGVSWRSTSAGRVIWVGVVLALLVATALGVLVVLAHLNQPTGPFGGRILVYSSEDGQGPRPWSSSRTTVVAVALDGSDPILVPDLIAAGKPVWSPDGTRFAIAAFRDEGVRLEIRGSDGEVDAVLPHPARGGAIAGYAWSPDGWKIAAAISVRGVDRLLIFDLRRLDAGPVDLTPAGVATSVSDLGTPWSPDGRSIAFIAQSLSSNDPRALWVVDVAAGKAHVVIERINGFEIGKVPVGYPISNVAWSPDGKLIAFDGAGLLGTAIFVVQPDGRGLLRIAPDLPSPLAPHWSSDGVRLVFDTGRAGGLAGYEVWAADADGTDVWRVMASGNAMGWSPDGWILVLSPGCWGTDLTCRQELLLVPAAGVVSTDDPRVRHLMSEDHVDALIGPRGNVWIPGLSWPGTIPAGSAPSP
jgi:dipeptidyl aminopeptidase/acylaminoacyl peptidase